MDSLGFFFSKVAYIFVIMDFICALQGMVFDYVQKLNIDSHHFQNPELQILQYLGPLYLVRLIHLKEE